MIEKGEYTAQRMKSLDSCGPARPARPRQRVLWGSAPSPPKGSYRGREMGHRGAPFCDRRGGHRLPSGFRLSSNQLLSFCCGLCTHERPPTVGRLGLHQRRRMPSALRVMRQGAEAFLWWGSGRGKACRYSWPRPRNCQQPFCRRRTYRGRISSRSWEAASPFSGWRTD